VAVGLIGLKNIFLRGLATGSCYYGNTWGSEITDRAPEYL